MRPVRVLATIMLLIAFAACGSEEPPPSTTAPPAAGSPSPPEDRDSAYGGGTASITVQTGESDLGTILTDSAGITLYVFGADKNGESACYDDCAQTWPALTVDGEPVAGEGLDASKLGTSDRTDGTVQVTYAGSPLYYFADDAAPGDTNGQGIGDIWFVVSPKGKPIT